mmetsp:Transcript_31723/g.92170  ORF Transcript_31723/g.92170 Transcript_31723/m.92170 type:complete len:332 (-) Transcript_31723:19-1014(-)
MGRQLLHRGERWQSAFISFLSGGWLARCSDRDSELSELDHALFQNPYVSFHEGRLYKIHCHDLHSPLYGEIDGNSLKSLHTLSRLDLSCNKIQGQLPGRAIQRLFQLTQLELSRNLLRGPIPTQLSSLTKLQDLSLARNQLTGSIPTGLSTLTALKTLDLSSNHLEGTIPEQLSELGDLLVLDLSWNRISGPLLHGLWRFQHLVKLSVHHNILTGPLPETVGRLKCAEYLHLQCNHLDGVLPLDALQRLNPGVRELLLHENRFFFRGNCEASEGDSQNMNRGGRSRKGARRQRHRPAQSGPRSRQGGSSSNTAEEARLELLEVFPDLTIVI